MSSFFRNCTIQPFFFSFWDISSCLVLYRFVVCEMKLRKLSEKENTYDIPYIYKYILDIVVYVRMLEWANLAYAIERIIVSRSYVRDVAKNTAPQSNIHGPYTYIVYKDRSRSHVRLSCPYVWMKCAFWKPPAVHKLRAEMLFDPLISIF